VVAASTVIGGKIESEGTQTETAACNPCSAAVVATAAVAVAAVVASLSAADVVLKLYPFAGYVAVVAAAAGDADVENDPFPSGCWHLSRRCCLEKLLPPL
jgi:hypothetical protein